MNFKIELFAADIRRKRREAQKTMMNVANEMGLSYAQVCKMEHGDHYPNIDTFMKAVKWLGTEPNRYFRTQQELSL